MMAPYVGTLSLYCLQSSKMVSTSSEYPLRKWINVDFQPQFWYSQHYRKIVQLQCHQWVGYRTELTRRELQKYEEIGQMQPYGKIIPLVELDTCPFIYLSDEGFWHPNKVTF